jgi:hypothetical protein
VWLARWKDTLEAWFDPDQRRHLEGNDGELWLACCRPDAMRRFAPAGLCAYMTRHDRRLLRVPLQAPAAEEGAGGARGASSGAGGPTRRTGNSRPDDANDDRKPPPAKSTIVTIRKRGSGEVPDLTPEEDQRRGDAADAIFREMKRRIAAKVRQGGA